MIKLITPPGMLVTVALLAIYSVYAFLIGSIEKSSLLTAGGVVSVLASYGTAMLRPWSRYLVYVLILGFVAKLGNSFVAAFEAGFFEFQFGSIREVLWSLTPTLLMTFLSIWCGVVVHRHFATKSPLAEEIDEMPDNEQPASETESDLPVSAHPEEGPPVR